MELFKSVKNRLTNFNPEAIRADGFAVGPQGFGELYLLILGLVS